MQNVNAEKIIESLDLETIKKEKESGKSLEVILQGIDLKPILRESTPNISEEQLDEMVKEIDLAKIVNNLSKIDINSVSGQSFEELSMEDMMILQGAGDVDVEITPTTITTSSGICAGGISAVGSAILSFFRC
ncbi:type 2 lantibiotic, SP_1948 family [Pilibacter termitis]|uniref:Type 2 lantibiotic, SP_1948 family n=1 Tax=Pilibacter termitis TaxID=263852 RepID=A0A1T4KFW1_9ENTE|nr:lichenicidin A2 family type 2 lantibiotic [Pilibacter termitis]SJZ41312.1 type 2 lantibiotic, SP_1948 family [Pilibacter termitis]